MNTLKRQRSTSIPVERSSARPRARAVVLGLALVPLLCWWTMRTEIISGGSELIEASLLVIVVFVLFLLVLLNEAVRRRRPDLAFTQAELLLVYVMQTTSVGLAGLGQIQFLNQALGGAFYYATPGNRWFTFHPHIPRWWVPDPTVLPAYYKGGSSFFTPEHLRGWATPILAWTAFNLLLLFCFLCLNTMLRRHWVEHERLTFPLVALPLELTRPGASRALLAHRGFWLAFLLACFFRSVSGMHRVLPSFPEFADFTFKGQQIDLAPYFAERPWDAIGFFRISFHPMIIGVAYFLPLDVSFSAWFFYLVVKAENILAAALGYRDAGAGPASALVPYTGEQGAGAFLAVAIFAFWGARRHLRDVLAKALGRAPHVRDGDEPLSYRTAVFGFLASFTGLVLFVSLGGMAWHLAALFFALYLLMILACTRFRAEAAPMLGYGPDLNPHRMMVLLPGSAGWSARDLTPFSYLQWFDSDYRTVAMPQQMEALKIADGVERPPTAERLTTFRRESAKWAKARKNAHQKVSLSRVRSFRAFATEVFHRLAAARGSGVEASTQRIWARWMLIAAAVAAVTAFVAVLAIYYHYGALTPRGDNGWRSYNGRSPFVTLKSWLDNPTRPDPTRLRWLGVGFAVATGLIRARSLFLWWPFHPAGFALAQAGAAMQWVWFPTLLGWLTKALLLRYGGIHLFRRAIPVFMGLLLGDIVIACVWSIIGVILDTQMYMFFPG